MSLMYGEWRYDKEGCVVSDSGMICDVGFMNVNPEANGRLIAAAPDLLEACECAWSSIKQRLICGKGEDTETERNMIMALLEEAIDKAKVKPCSKKG